jgi:hypothetical protein
MCIWLCVLCSFCFLSLSFFSLVYLLPAPSHEGPSVLCFSFFKTRSIHAEFVMNTPSKIEKSASSFFLL